MVEVSKEEIQRRNVVTQELAPLEVISGVQDVQIATSSEKVWTQLPQNFINLDSDNEEHHEADKRTLNLENRSEEVEESSGEISRGDGFSR